MRTSPVVQRGPAYTERVSTVDTRSSADLDTDTASLRGFGIFLLVTATIGWLAAFILTIEKVNLLKNPGEALACDISAFVSCGGVVNQEQAEVFGFPNPLMGIAGFAVVATIGVLLASGGTIPRWFWAGLQAGVLFGVGFVTWLQSQSIYVIEVLCPYCMVVWLVMIPMFVVTTGQVLRQYRPDSGLTRFVNDWRVLITALWLITIAALIWFQFGSRLFA